MLKNIILVDLNYADSYKKCKPSCLRFVNNNNLESCNTDLEPQPRITDYNVCLPFPPH